MRCEKCWGDAYILMLNCQCTSQVYHYDKIMDGGKSSPCTPKEQAGQWWNEETQRDERVE